MPDFARQFAMSGLVEKFQHSGPKLAFGMVGEGDLKISPNISPNVANIWADRFSDAITGSRERPSAGLWEKRMWSCAGPRPVTKKWYFWPHGSSKCAPSGPLCPDITLIFYINNFWPSNILSCLKIMYTYQQNTKCQLQ